MFLEIKILIIRIHTKILKRSQPTASSGYPLCSISFSTLHSFWGVWTSDFSEQLFLHMGKITGSFQKVKKEKWHGRQGSRKVSLAFPLFPHLGEPGLQNGRLAGRRVASRWTPAVLHSSFPSLGRSVDRPLGSGMFQVGELPVATQNYLLLLMYLICK